MSSNKSLLDSTLLLNRDTPCDSISDVTGHENKSSTMKALENNEMDLNSCPRDNVSERLKMDDVDNTIINGKKPLSYEKINGFTCNVKHHESTVNGETIEVASACDVDTRNVSRALTSGEVNSDDVCSIPKEHDAINSNQLTEKCTAEFPDSVEEHSEEGHSVEDLIVKLASTSMSLDEDSEQIPFPISSDLINGISYVIYESEKQMPDIMRLITKDLSEPYSIYTYRYFIHNWPKLCFLAMDNHNCVGAIVCKLDVHKKMVRRGYIAMLAVDSEYRRMRIGSTLVTKAIHAMIRDDCDEVVLETEITNQAALHLYENLGFVRDKRLFRYYLNGVDALRLKLWLR